ncbi:long-chain-fatty-acid--CoA ligase [Dictyobacter alpinus]|uniref:Long-chain-fatty-acid--CoA ligase n=1 Tax=Dictyobacter alpinus TaxID=2014873 RepID=A0A402BGI8_9CHLR|nr:AMP-binding protein [Dictyobacter alpinus]GCE30390.1 long-chain-fatty-acid--CoA ligase [Dictyobacter alpinus]
MESIVEAVFWHAQQDPERPALFFGPQVLSYGQLATDVTRFAAALQSSGIQAGERVALFLANSPAFITAYLGTQLAGGIVVLINTQYRKVELSHILNDAGVRLCITSAPGAEEIQVLAVPTLKMLVLVDASQPTFMAATYEYTSFEDFVQRGAQTAELSESAKLAQSLPMPQSTDPAVIGYTSGTTGRSKGALLLHSNLLANSRAVTNAWHWTQQDRLLLTLPLFHTHGLMVGVHGTLLMGASLILKAKFDAVDVLSTLHNDASITLFFGVPTMYSRLLTEAEHQGAPEHALRLYVSGSAPLSPQVFKDFERILGQRILERYGMTETIMNLTNPYEGERRPGTVGWPFPGQEARVVDVQSRRVLPPDEIGEIEVRGPHVFAGYWQRPEATAEVLAADGWFKTGDLGWYSQDGYYTITGRARELIISGGYNIYPREIEDVLELHPDIAEVAVIGMPDADMGEQVVAVIVAQAGCVPDQASIIAFCREQLASYKKPRRIVVVDRLPRNALGKVQKHILAAQLPSS